MSGKGGATGAERRARRDVTRVLKATARPTPCGREGDEALIARANGTMRVPMTIVDGLVRGGALWWQAGGNRSVRCLVRTEAGTATLRRLLAEPDMDAHGEQHRLRTAGVIGGDGSDDVTEPVTRNALESPLDRLAIARERDGSPFLHPELVEAGRRLRADFERSHLRARTTMAWEAPTSSGSGARGGGGGDLTDAALGARTRYARAVDALGPRLGPALADFAAHEMGLTDVERRHDWPARSGKMMLREALDRLAAHYRGG